MGLFKEIGNTWRIRRNKLYYILLIEILLILSDRKE
jgi:hypothetical protein